VSFTVALIGPDGAGKSTIARRLETTFPSPLKVLYMGINTESSNVALPTTRFIGRMRQTRLRKAATPPAGAAAADRTTRKPSGKLWAAARLVNRLAEEWYRQFLSWSYVRRGNIVVYDRHFKFDFECDKSPQRSFSDRLHRWCLAKFYPLPDLVIYLDAPAEVLFARKGEATLQWLEARREAFRNQGARMSGFVQVDATQLIDAVYADVCQHIQIFQRMRAEGRTSQSSIERLKDPIVRGE
jgi:thymidylate kinase